MTQLVRANGRQCFICLAVIAADARRRKRSRQILGAIHD